MGGGGGVGFFLSRNLLLPESIYQRDHDSTFLDYFNICHCVLFVRCVGVYSVSEVVFFVFVFKFACLSRNVLLPESIFST